ncbi:integrase domain-containing protein [Nitrospira sp. Kam-Ns4a]
MGNNWKGELAGLLRVHGRISHDRARVLSTATLEKRSQVLFGAFRTLRELGYQLPSVRGLGGRHVRALCEAWTARGLSAAEWQNRLSVLRVFAAWINKPGLVDQVARNYREQMRRTYVATRDKSWAAQGVEARARIAELATREPRIAAALALQREFGLRVRESLCVRPHLADQGTHLAVNRGTKGGRDRTVPITTPEQRAALERAKALTRGTQTLGQGERTGLTYHQVERRYYYVMEREGLTRKTGLTSHGLRHEYAQERYEALTGAPSPVRGGDVEAGDPERVAIARMTVAEDLGHSRESVTHAYLGSFR